ncbi:MAG: hypothetical protein QXV95_01705 [Sulfolobales archaeon]
MVGMNRDTCNYCVCSGVGSSSMMGRELIEALPEVLKVWSAWGRPASPQG